MTRENVQHMSKSLTVKVCKLKGYWKKWGMAEAPFSHAWLNSPEFSLRKPVTFLLQRNYMDRWVLCYRINTNRSHVLDPMSKLASHVVDLSHMLIWGHKLNPLSTTLWGKKPTEVELDITKSLSAMMHVSRNQSPANSETVAGISGMFPITAIVSHSEYARLCGSHSL